MGKTRKDLFEMWNETGKWPEVRDFLFDCFSKLVTQKEICERLQMDEATFIKLKKKHPEIERLKQDARLDLKRNLIGAMYKKAIGYEVTEEDQYLEEGAGNKGTKKKKAHKFKRHIPGDYKAIVYLLSHNFGREFSERVFDYELVEKKIEAGEEVWLNGDKDSEDSD